MTNEKVKRVLQDYFEKLEARRPGIEPEQLMPRLMLETSSYLGRCTHLAHLKFMCQEAQKFVDEGQIEKAMRWLGFLQGVFWTMDWATLDELRKHSMPDAG